MFIRMAKEGVKTLSDDGRTGPLTISLCVHTAATEGFLDKLLNTSVRTRYHDTAESNIRFCVILLYDIARWLGGRFISADYLKRPCGACENAATSAPARCFRRFTRPTGTAMQTALVLLEIEHRAQARRRARCRLLMVPELRMLQVRTCGQHPLCQLKSSLESPLR